jgi:hypothetical protein
MFSVTSRRLNVRNFHCVLFCWYLVILEIIRKLLYILTVLQHLSLEVVVQLSPASVWVSGVIVHLTSKGIHTHHNTSYSCSTVYLVQQPDVRYSRREHSTVHQGVALDIQ